jgi:hypothetical protein
MRWAKAPPGQAELKGDGAKRRQAAADQSADRSAHSKELALALQQFGRKSSNDGWGDARIRDLCPTRFVQIAGRAFPQTLAHVPHVERRWETRSRPPE